MLGVPLLIQEQNAVPGLVTRLLARWAERIHVAFPEAIERLPRGRARARVTGNPVRPASQLDRAAARVELGLPEDAVVLLVVGGSQGSLALNEALLEAVAAVREGRAERPAALHVLWATGPRHHAAVTDALGGVAWVRAVPYLEDMPVALAAADLALARAGAMFTAELLDQGLPAILVPLPTAAADHQTRNAEALSNAGAAVLLPQSELGAARLWEAVDGLLGRPDALPRMRAAAHALARPDAASELAASVVSIFRTSGRVR
jgi:UDP-N-acetylglucosamine--N-acetylmuramyl-(pentapeptide) pyrophosphoryl-undecaprenol N-acetylglucosamine transferase